MKQKKFYSPNYSYSQLSPCSFHVAVKNRPHTTVCKMKSVKNSLNTKLPVGRYRVPREHFAAYSLP